MNDFRKFVVLGVVSGKHYLKKREIVYKVRSNVPYGRQLIMEETCGDLLNFSQTCLEKTI
jgi:hypothetical protein